MGQHANIERVTVVGVGLIGGSVARALKLRCGDVHIVGYDQQAGQLERAQALGVVDETATDIARAVRDAQVIVVAVTLGATREILAAIAPHLSAQTVITDTGSAKQDVVRSARATLGAGFSCFVPAHPLAGAERSGVDASDADLFQQRRVVVTPAAETAPAAVALVKTLWRQCGAEVVSMSARAHDEVLAATSHLPHLLAYALIECLAELKTDTEVFDFTAGGFHDMTRIAASNPLLWRDICLANGAELVRACEHFEATLRELKGAIAARDRAVLAATFARAQQLRLEIGARRATPPADPPVNDDAT